MVRNAFKHKTSTSYFWTDSSTILRYLENEDKTYCTFVANRINKITNATDKSQWCFVPSEDNPADIASRGDETQSIP